MSGTVVTSVFISLCLLNIFVVCASFKIPDLKIEAFKPKGFRVSIPDTSKTTFFVFQGNINEPISSSDIGAISAEITKADKGRWTYEDPNLELKEGDTINYHIFVSNDRNGYIKDNQSYTVSSLQDKFANPTKDSSECVPSKTKLLNSVACAGQIIFEDKFDSFQEDVWQLEQYVPIDNPEHPFISYQRVPSDPTIFVNNGQLHIVPKLQQNLPGYSNESIYSGTLDLFSGCTSSADACIIESSGANILPPVVTGRVTSKRFAFTYGIVNIRAKLPQGDWLYPEILLEPLMKKYGIDHFASGVIKIANAIGNKNIKFGLIDIGNQVLYGGPILDFDCRESLVESQIAPNGKGWGDEFHDFSVKWTPDSITLSVDGDVYATISPSVNGGLYNQLSNGCNKVPQYLLRKGSPMAPFDDHFYITLGLSAGGISEFDDNSVSNGRPKPWRNSERKGILHFWQHMNDWWPSWRESKLVVDSITVLAL